MDSTESRRSAAGHTELVPYDSDWNRATATHLLRRAGFAPDEASIQHALAAGLDATVDGLLDPPAESSRAAELDALADEFASRREIARLREWWLLRMCYTHRPLHARMSLFWHNHFATSFVKVQSAPLMLRQLRLFERHALRRFGDLLREVSRDPAMIIWLDGAANVKGRPNENFARELFELFSLGVGHYSEADIRGAARAFSGWHERRGEFHFAASEHDDGEKTVLGQTGRFDGDDIVRLALEQPAAARFVAGKLLREFVMPRPPQPLIEAVAARLRASDFDIRQTLRDVLRSQVFFAHEVYRARIKSPVEFAVGVVRSLHLRVPGPRLAEAVSQLGQRLFEPPTVKGWEGHRRWLNSATMLVRLNAAAEALNSTDDGKGFDTAGFLSRYRLDSPDAIIAFCGDLLLDGRVPDALSAQLRGLADTDLTSLLRRTLMLLLTSPEYQLA